MTVKIEDILCKVTFPASAKDAYTHKYGDETPAQTVVDDAVRHFQLPNDGTTRYYLFFDGAEVPATTTLGALAATGHGNDGHGQAKLDLGLRVETISG